jgi:predicted ABC-class ATPase
VLTREDLRKQLMRIDGKGYKAYKDIQGVYDYLFCKLFIDHVQGDPFASPSRVRIEIQLDKTGVLPELRDSRVKQIALEDYLCRQFKRSIGKYSRRVRGIGKSGLIVIDCNKQYVLERNSVLITDQTLEVRFVVGLPAQGRTILGSEAISLFLQQIPQIAEQALFLRNLNVRELKHFINTAEDQEAIRKWLREAGMVAFVADGSILPRRSGVDDRPLLVNPVPFYSTDELAVNIDLPHRGMVRGMGIPPGVTLIVGGGFHGKSTLLNALEVGVYNHIPGDGREYVISHRDSLKIRAENGRSIQKVNISPFINKLPLMGDTTRFSTENASGSTSQAASIIEALESGARVLLIDEDTSATNFMIRDERMQELVVKEKEPITPFIDKVDKMYQDFGVSTLLVMGGSGDYFDVADTVIMMDEFRPRSVTRKAKEIVSRNGLQRKDEGGDSFGELTPRKPTAHSFDASRGRKEVKIDAKGLHGMLYGENFVELSALEQLLDSGQTRCIGLIIYYYSQHYRGNSKNLTDGLRQVMREVKEKGLDILQPFKAGNLALPRIFEVAGAINRMRSLRNE